jgi:hypothetical protein
MDGADDEKEQSRDAAEETPALDSGSLPTPPVRDAFVFESPGSSTDRATDSPTGTTEEWDSPRRRMRRQARVREGLPALPRASARREFADWALAAAFFGGGFLLIVTLKVLGVNAVAVACLAVLAMLIYAVLAYRVPNIRMRPDKLGDNLYYMGFVFTLASMSAALIQLHRSPNQIDDIIGAFGIALFTTIAGIAGRVTILQMRTELEDVEETARRTLLEYARELRGQLSAAIDDLEIFRRGVRQALDERLRESIDAHQRAIDRQLGTLEETGRSVIASVASSASASDELFKEMRAEIEASVIELQSMRKKLGAVRVPSDIIEKKLGGAIAKVEATVEAFETTAKEEAARHAALTDVAGQLNDVLAGLNAQLAIAKEASAGLGKAADPAGALADRLADLTGHAGSAAHTLAEVKEAVRSAIALAREHEEALASILATSRDRATQVNQTVAEAASGLAEAARDVTEKVRLVASAMSSQPALVGGGPVRVSPQGETPTRDSLLEGTDSSDARSHGDRAPDDAARKNRVRPWPWRVG